ncbi:hypothetical protein, partial [Leptospira alexanderi]|uniref:hypothetical protein n=1 Tax=Leptospira alexanderi TaxID=100053 RepID=UPI001C37669D
NSEGIGAKSAVASHFIYEIRERFAQTFLRRTHVNLWVVLFLCFAKSFRLTLPLASANSILTEYSISHASQRAFA